MVYRQNVPLAIITVYIGTESITQAVSKNGIVGDMVTVQYGRYQSIPFHHHRPSTIRGK